MKLADYFFADQSSADAAALADEYCRLGQRGAFLLSGPPASGKTTLVRACVPGGLTYVASFPRDERAMNILLVTALQRGHICFDNVRKKKSPAALAVLQAFITSEHGHWRPLGKAEAMTKENRCVVFLTCEDKRDWPADFLRAVRIIRMAGREEIGA